MRLRPRHYVLIAILLAVGVYNLYRARRAHAPQPIAVSVPSGPVSQSPLWSAFDKAAGLRDAADAQFSPALQTLQQAVDAATNDPTLADVKGCQTWLLYYRQGVVHPTKDTAWSERSTQHLNICVKTHHDAG